MEPDIVLVSIDTLRADHLGTYGYPVPTSPFIDSLADDGVVFDNAFSSSSHTAPSHTSTFTSLYPEAHGVLRNGSPLAPETFTTLAGALAGADVETAMFSSVRFLERVSEGFSHVDIPDSEAFPAYRPAAVTVDAALDWLAADRRPAALFMVVHLFDVHDHRPGSYAPSPFMERIGDYYDGRRQELMDYRREFVGPTNMRSKDLGHLRRYDAKLAYVDSEIERLYGEFRRQRGDRESIWIITSDHGEGLRNHGWLSHGRYLYNEQLHVPLIVHGAPERWPPRRVAEMVRLVDLFPTILELAGAPEVETLQQIEGVSFGPLLSGSGAMPAVDYVYAQRRPLDKKRRDQNWEDGLVISAQNLEEKYIFYEAREDEYFDLVNDPFEMVNLVGQDLPEAESLRRWLLGRYAKMKSERPTAEAEILPEHIDELRALGYLD